MPISELYRFLFSLFQTVLLIHDMLAWIRIWIRIRILLFFIIVLQKTNVLKSKSLAPVSMPISELYRSLSPLLVLVPKQWCWVTPNVADPWYVGVDSDPDPDPTMFVIVLQETPTSCPCSKTVVLSDSQCCGSFRHWPSRRQQKQIF